MNPEILPGSKRTLVDYSRATDREVVARAQCGDARAADYLLVKYRNLVRTRVKSFFLPGAEKDDLLQVGMVGLWQAVVDFRGDKAVSFPAFAKVCIQRQIITVIKTATRQKHQPLNTSLSLESPSGDPAAAQNLADIVTGDIALDPEEVLLRREDAARLQAGLRQLLSGFEWAVLDGYQAGNSYEEIAAALGCKTKSVDNALVRIKRKVTSISFGGAADPVLWSYVLERETDAA